MSPFSVTHRAHQLKLHIENYINSSFVFTEASDNLEYCPTVTINVKSFKPIEYITIDFEYKGFDD